ncbi:hydroxyacylglutathione hydrolase [Alishewanella sp. 16-MA]|uniref:Hydroxyacylglutathione hydrolase n=1 Tax=Alishewanella maricola TaxID=2795740 RepID=A0ABS8C0N5_9ALTE|nr:hydroxyacylglutathione hydrolase [Alishewanella maricola]MCB5225733.1 hydroxyacylglutathione hydrolase [Alishewanella maricola]
MLDISPIHAFQDNYIWVMSRPNQPHCLLVDPGDATVVNQYLQQTGKQLLGILITHHHADHTGGLAQLKQQWPEVRIIGPEAEQHKIPLLTETVADNSIIHFPELNWHCQTLQVPGHTAGHVAYYSADVLFCGDTLFSGGCGRLFEGTPAQMLQSLQRLAHLPSTTKVYCTHEYTLTNLRFACEVEPDNLDLLDYQQQSQLKRQNNQETLPSNLALEKKINPFLRCENIALQHKFKQSSALELFTYLRAAKDQFKS